MPAPSPRFGLLDRVPGPGRALLALSIVLPALLFGLAAWQGYRGALREAGARADRTARVLQEHAVKVFETHRLAIELVNGRLRFMDWASDTDRADLHGLLKGLQGLDQIATITVTDAEGRMLASSRVFPVDRSLSFADRDWFEGVQTADVKPAFVSRSFTGLQSSRAVFNVAGRAYSPVPGAFNGVVAVSVDRSYFESFYLGLEPEYENDVLLMRSDGEILARQPAVELTRMLARSAFLRQVKEAENGTYAAQSSRDSRARIYGYRRLGEYPVYVRFGITIDSALGPWRQSLVVYGIVAVLASLALVFVSALAIRQTRRERLATARWQGAAADLKAEAASRERVEGQLRQSQKMEAVGRLTGGVAHDFNNLLTVVTGNLDLLRRRMVSDERAARLLANAVEGANRAAALTHRLLAFSRQQPLDPKPLDVNRLVGGMSDLLLRTLGEDVVVETVLAGGLWPAFADPNQLESALLNLAVNARDAMPSGGKLTIETANAHLDDAYAAAHPELSAGQFVMIAVSDTGSGMPAEVVARAFEPFFTTKAVGKGTGLGLSQVYGFARQSNGHAAIYSEPGQGTTVKLYLPRRHGPGAEPARAEPDAVAGPDATQGETVLVIEDDAMVRQFSVECLRDTGYRVLEAADGPSGLALLRAHADVDLLFTDVVLTGPLNGRQVADEATALRPHLPVLFTTGYTRNAIIHHGRLDDGVNLLGKPFTASALADRVRALLDTSAARA